MSGSETTQGHLYSTVLLIRGELVQLLCESPLWHVSRTFPWLQLPDCVDSCHFVELGVCSFPAPWLCCLNILVCMFSCVFCEDKYELLRWFSSQGTKVMAVGQEFIFSHLKVYKCLKHKQRDVNQLLLDSGVDEWRHITVWLYLSVALSHTTGR